MLNTAHAAWHAAAALNVVMACTVDSSGRELVTFVLRHSSYNKAIKVGTSQIIALDMN